MSPQVPDGLGPAISAQVNFAFQPAFFEIPGSPPLCLERSHDTHLRIILLQFNLSTIINVL